MKKIKFYICIALMGVCSISCSKDDDNVSNAYSVKKIIGLWQFNELVQNGEPIDLGICASQSTYEFLEDGTLIVTTVVPDEMDEGECLKGTINGNWEYLNGNDFNITLDGQSHVNEIVVSENGTVMTVTTVEENGFVQELSLIKID